MRLSEKHQLTATVTNKEFNDGAHRLVEAFNQILALHFWTHRIRPHLEKQPDFRDALPAFDNAILESCLATFRALDVFFANRVNAGRKDDLFAKDFNGFVAKHGLLTSKQREKLNKTVFHFTKRHLLAQIEKYEYGSMLARAIPLCIDFIDHVRAYAQYNLNDEDRVKFLDDTRRHLETLGARYKNS